MANKFPSFLRVVITSKSESVEVNGKMETKVVFDRTVLKLTELLAQALQFSCELIPAGKIEIGRRLPNGSWTGLVGLVQRNETDMVISTLSVSEQRLQVADFSYPYNRVRLTFATRKPEYSPELLAFLLPFSLDVWLFTVTSLLFIPAACYVLFERKYAFRKLIFAAYKTIVNEDMGIEPRRLREYILLTFWQIGAVFLIFCYTAVLLSFLTFPTLSGIRTIPELAVAVAKGKYQCTCYPGSFLLRILTKSPDPKDRIIGRNLMENKGSRDIEAVLDNKKSGKKPVFIGGEDDLLPYKLKYFVSEDEFIPALRSIALQKTFCCKRQVDKVVGYVWASGIFQKLKEEDMFLESMRLVLRFSDILQKKKERSLTAEDLAGAFALLTLGYIFATIVLILELIIGKLRRKKNNHVYWNKKKLRIKRNNHHSSNKKKQSFFIKAKTGKVNFWLFGFNNDL